MGIMKIAQINNVYGFSTGAVMNSIAQYGWLQGEEIYTFSPPEYDNMPDFPGHYYVGSVEERIEHQKKAELYALDGFYSENATRQMLDLFEKLNIQLIHMHNINAFSFNFSILVDYIKSRNLPVIWTLHDCRPFTGGCLHFSAAKCLKWEKDDGCYDCPQLKIKSGSLNIDSPSFVLKWKKEHFGKIKNMTIVAPSEWMAGLARRSFLGKYSVNVIHNGVNTWIFSPIESDFRQRYNLQGKIVLLGVASVWRYQKGIETICRLSERLSSKYQIVIVGNTDCLKNKLPQAILSIPYIRSSLELAKLYTAADFFINPTLEENYPTVNMEALACGTPVITYDTGGSPEILDNSSGCVVPYNDLDALVHTIEEETETRKLTKEACLKRAKVFNQDIMCKAYLDLYRKILKNY